MRGHVLHSWNEIGCKAEKNQFSVIYCYLFNNPNNNIFFFFGWVYLFILKKFKNFGGRQSKVHFSLLREQDLHSRCSGCCTHTVCNILSRKCEFNSPGLTLAEYKSLISWSFKYKEITEVDFHPLQKMLSHGLCRLTSTSVEFSAIAKYLPGYSNSLFQQWSLVLKAANSQPGHRTHTLQCA